MARGCADLRVKTGNAVHYATCHTMDCADLRVKTGKVVPLGRITANIRAREAETPTYNRIGRGCYTYALSENIHIRYICRLHIHMYLDNPDL